MATKQRAQSSTGFYHVFHRGVNQFDIFEDDEDRQYYRDHLQKYARDLGVEVHAWCLMSNHSHLLLKADHEVLPVFMRQLGSTYARFFNRRHARSGPLFEGRFDSVCVESDEQLISVVRYIHRNPIHHEEETLFGTYPWSSFKEYVAGAPELCEIAFALELFGSVDSFVDYHEGWDESERHLDMDTLGRMGDDEARRRADVIYDKLPEGPAFFDEETVTEFIHCIKRMPFAVRPLVAVAGKVATHTPFAL